MNKCDVVRENMAVYRDMYNNLKGLFDGCKVSHINRASNEEEDNLANIGSQCLSIPPGVLLEEIKERCIKEKPAEAEKPKKSKAAKGKKDSSAPEEEETEEGAEGEIEEVMMVETTWMHPYLAYMMIKELRENQVKARGITRWSKAFRVSSSDVSHPRKDMPSSSTYSRVSTGIMQAAAQSRSKLSELASTG
jgi:hypothetical protein